MHATQDSDYEFIEITIYIKLEFENYIKQIVPNCITHRFITS